MANDVFNIKTDLSIRYYNASIASYVEIVADSFEVDIDRGIDIEDGVFAQGSIGTAKIKLVKANLSDFLGTPGYKANDYLEIRYRSAPDTAPLIYNYLFTGFIQNVSMGYINESGTLQIEITVNDVMKTFLNTQLANFAISGTVAARSFRNCMINLSAAINSSVTFPTAILPSGIPLVPAGAGGSATTQYAFTWPGSTSSGEILSRFIDAELGWVWAAINQPKVQYFTRTDVASLRALTYNTASPTISNVHYTNLISNGNFETNTTGWTGGSGVTLTRDTTQFYMGAASMRANRASGSNAYSYFTNTTMNAAAGDKLKATMWGKALISLSGQARVKVNYINSLGTQVGSSTGDYVSLSLTEWKEFNVTGVMPATAVRAEVVIEVVAGTAGASGMYIDNAKLENLTNISSNHFCLDNITLKYDSDLLVNKVKVTETNSSTSATATNTASVSANGEQSAQYSVIFDHLNSSNTLANMATRISNSATIKQIDQVSVPAIRDNGLVSYVVDYDIGYTIQVEFAQEPLAPLQVITLISRISHNITPDYWGMTLGLWRAI
jgi:hypothetical protein